MASTSAFPYEEIVERITVVHIQTPIDRLTGFTPGSSAEVAHRTLKKHRFDFGPVRNNGDLLGRANLKKLLDLKGPIGDAYEPLGEHYLISSGSSIRSAMEWLVHDPWLLVVDGRRITGLITPSDLNRQASRAYFYLLVADFEIRLADAIREEFTDLEEVYALLQSFAVKRAKRNHENAKKGDIDSDLVAAMHLSDLLSVVFNSDDVRNRLEYVQDDDWRWAHAEVNDFRTQVMHPTKPLLDDTSGLERLIRIEGRLRRLAGDGSSPRVREGAA